MPHPTRRGNLLVSMAIALCCTGAGAQTDTPANPLEALQPLLGFWGIPPEVVEQHPEFADRIVHNYEWTVGHNAMRLREGFPRGDESNSELDGLVYWDPTTQRTEFVSVAGHGTHEGRLFRGEYRILDDGSIERVYDVFYRSAADMPGEELGGDRRRFREVYRREGERLFATLDWWLEDRWQPFGPGKYELVIVILGPTEDGR